MPWLTNSMPLIAAGDATGNERFPLDTYQADGLYPQDGAITLAALRTFVQLGEGSGGTATATAGAATLNLAAGKVTTEALTTAAGALYTLTLANTTVAATSIVTGSLANGTNTTAGGVIERMQPSANQVVITVRNTHASAALNGTLVISYLVHGNIA